MTIAKGGLNHVSHRSGRGRLVRPQCVAALVGALLACVPPHGGFGLAQEPGAPNTGELVNYPFFYGSGLDSGLGEYSVGERTVQMLTIRPRVMLRSPWKYSWGLRLRLTATVGSYDFQSLEETIESFRAVALVPGLEVLFPLSSRSLIYPFIDLGFGSNRQTTDPVLVGALGVASEFVFPLKRFEMGLEPRAQFALSRASEANLEEDFGGVGVRSDIRHPLPFRILGEAAELAAYVGIGWYGVPLTFTDPDGRQLEVDEQYEVGLIFGTHPRPKVWFVRLPRLGFGVRFGDGLTSYRIIITGDRVTRLPPQ